MLAAGGCGSDEEAVAPAVLIPPPAAPAVTAAAPAQRLRPAPPAGDPQEAPAPASRGRLTVHLTRPASLYASPGGSIVGRVAPRTTFDSPTVLPVVRRQGSWLGVLTTELPNGRVGWIPANAALVPYRTAYSVTASLGRREVVVRRAGRVVQRFQVAVGSPSTPTPTGRFAVTDKLLTQDPSSPYGCCILALNARQTRTPQGWGGGDRVAIHATNLPETIGTAASLGCMRAPTEAMRRAVRLVPLGTLVIVRA